MKPQCWSTTVQYCCRGMLKSSRMQACTVTGRHVWMCARTCFDVEMRKDAAAVYAALQQHQAEHQLHTH